MESLVIDDTLKLYNLMLNDIANAKSYIYLETYKFANDHMGVRFRDALTRKAQQGVDVRILIDSWGKGPISESFFSTLIANKGEVKFFEKIKLNSDLFTRGHRRDHRKILVIDDEICYLGSANITGYNLNWRELSIRMKGEIAVVFKKIFEQNFEAFNPYNITSKVNFSKTMKYAGFRDPARCSLHADPADQEEIYPDDPRCKVKHRDRDSLFPARLPPEESPDGCRQEGGGCEGHHAETLGCADGRYPAEQVLRALLQEQCQAAVLFAV